MGPKISGKPMQKVDKKEENKRPEPPQEDIPDLENDICNICVCNQNNIVLEPCGHTSICQDCVSRIIKKTRDQEGNLIASLKCPYCQGKVDKILKLKRHLFDTTPEKEEPVEKDHSDPDMDEL
jgi:hypothetical protein